MALVRIQTHTTNTFAIYFFHFLTIGLCGPYSITQAQTTRDDIEHWQITTAWFPPE